MSQIVLGTVAVRLDEKAYWLLEMNQQSPGSRGFRRYQIIHVIRGDRPTEFRRDLGPARDFQAPAFSIPAFLEHTVGELCDLAEALRNGDIAQPEVQPSDVIQGYYDTRDARRLRRRGRKSFRVKESACQPSQRS